MKEKVSSIHRLISQRSTEHPSPHNNKLLLQTREGKPSLVSYLVLSFLSLPLSLLPSSILFFLSHLPSFFYHISRYTFASHHISPQNIADTQNLLSLFHHKSILSPQSLHPFSYTFFFWLLLYWLSFLRFRYQLFTSETNWKGRGEVVWG